MVSLGCWPAPDMPIHCDGVIHDLVPPLWSLMQPKERKW